MNVFLSRVDFMPLVYGIAMFAGILVMWLKLVHMKVFSLLIDIAVFTLVFKLHGGSMAGSFAAMIAALLAGLIFPMLTRS